MATGDAIGAITSTSASTYLTVQPSSGVSWTIRHYGTGSWVSGNSTTIDGYPNMDFGIYDGTTFVPIYYRARVYMQGGTGMYHGVPGNNTYYFRLYNNAGSAQDLSYNGLQS